MELAQSVEMGTLVANFMTGLGRRCVYKFSFGLVVVPGSDNLGCPEKVPSAATSHGKILNDNWDKAMKKYVSPVKLFSFTTFALERIVEYRDWYESEYANTCALMIAWGYWEFNDGTRSDDLIVSFYESHQLPEIQHGIQTFDGVDVVFFIPPDMGPRFDGNTLDHDGEKFFLVRKEP